VALGWTLESFFAFFNSVLKDDFATRLLQKLISLRSCFENEM
jgi:hypothetical protein